MSDKVRTIYIAGPITGRVREEYENDFGYAEATLKSQGFLVCNPVWMMQDLAEQGASWGVIMKLCCAMVTQVDDIALLPGWRESRGAVLEYRTFRKHADPKAKVYRVKFVRNNGILRTVVFPCIVRKRADVIEKSTDQEMLRKDIQTLRRDMQRLSQSLEPLVNPR